MPNNFAESPQEAPAQDDPEVDPVGEILDNHENFVNVIPPATRTVSSAAQTEEEDSVDSSIVIANRFRNGMGTNAWDSFDGRCMQNVDNEREQSRTLRAIADTLRYTNSITTATQTGVDDPITARGQQLSYLIIQGLALRNPVNISVKDAVLESLLYNVTEIIENNSVVLNNLVHSVGTPHYLMFSSVAKGLFEADGNNEMVELRIIWSRIITVFAFAVRHVQEYSGNLERVDSITRFLASYVTKHIIPFVKENDGWDGLLVHFPPPTGAEVQMRTENVWSGLYVALVATMCISSLLR